MTDQEKTLAELYSRLMSLISGMDTLQLMDLIRAARKITEREN
jgi:hypothetical protein